MKLLITISLFLSLALASTAKAEESTEAKAEEAVAVQTEETADKAEAHSIDIFLSKLYTYWNEHDLEGLFSLYGSNFSNGDGLDKDQLKDLTESLWENYPDLEVTQQSQTIRSQDQYATISLVDFFSGKTAEKHKDLEIKGVLSAVSQGELFLKKYGKDWKVESDKISFELVTVHYGDVDKYLNDNQIYFAAPEQVHSGDQYTGTLFFILPENIQATATINNELIVRPAIPVEESFQAVSGHKLERLFTANKTNHNELISATMIITKGLLEPSLEGLLFISKRINVVPSRRKLKEDQVAMSSFADSKKKKKKKDKETKAKKEGEDENSKNN